MKFINTMLTFVLTLLNNLSQNIPHGSDIFHETELQILWNRGCIEDQDFKCLYEVLKDEERNFPSQLKTQISISECVLMKMVYLASDVVSRYLVGSLYKLPSFKKPMIHISQGTYAVITQTLFCQVFLSSQRSHQWCGYYSKIATFVDFQRPGVKIKKRILLPLPMPDRFYSELSIDLMTKLPAKFKHSPHF